MLREKEDLYKDYEFEKFRREAMMDIETKNKPVRSKTVSFFDPGSLKNPGPVEAEQTGH